MYDTFQPQAPVNLFRLSDGAEHHPREEGHFQVRYNCKVNSFPTLVKAFVFYLRLNEAATLWDVSQGAYLVERKIPLLAD